MQQATALNILNSGRSVFLTGAPGAGKTWTLNQFIQQARKQEKHIAITASTGIASTHVDGQTIHSWAGIGVNKCLTPKLMGIIRARRAETIENTDILVIDEISMIPAYLLDMVDEICRRIRHNDEPFGGIQVIMSGDFYQLPPVTGKQVTQPPVEWKRTLNKYMQAGRDPEGFVTESFAWRHLDPTICYLTEQHRQTGGQLLQVLTHMREGHMTGEDKRILSTRLRKRPDKDKPVTHLYPTNRQADTLNRQRLDRLTGEPVYFHAHSKGKDRKLVDALMRNMLAPEHLILKQDATVMALRNDPEGKYVNGSIGRVRSFASSSLGMLPIVEFDNGHTVIMKPARWEIRDETIDPPEDPMKRLIAGEDYNLLARVEQIPLRCAWAITIHKSQGMTLDNAVMDLKRSFSESMGYVALSRVSGLDGLFLDDLSDRAYKVSAKARELDDMLRDKSVQAEREEQARETVHLIDTA